jgi:hypothetical protein
LARGGTVTSSNPGTAPEDMTKAFDENELTKWFAGNGIRTGWIAYEFAGSMPHTVTTYEVTSANDMPTRDPATWELQGSNDGTTWTAVDARAAQTFAARFQTNTYACMRTASYRRYRLKITANGGANELQVADLTLFGF